MQHYSALSDDFYVNMNLATEMELPSNRETVLHYFERIQKTYPQMRKFYCRDKRDYVLEEDKERGQYRWTTVESRRLCSGYVNPPELDDALQQHRLVLELAPYMLSLSPLDCEALDLMFGFDFTYRGNHNQLVAEALGVMPAFDKLAELAGSATVGYEPSITLSLDAECRTQVRVSIETRTTAAQIRTGDYPEQLSVYVTARQYGSLGTEATFVSRLNHLAETATKVIDSYVTDQILKPLARMIALK